MSSHSKDLEEYMRQLKQDRLIKIFIGTETTIPYQVAESALKRASKYFASAIKNEHFGGEQNIGILRFVDDGPFEAAWEIVLFWITTGTFPKGLILDSDQLRMLLVDCWVLGDKYLMPDFQDMVMLRLMVATTGFFRSAEGSSSWETLVHGLSIAPSGSKLRAFMVIEVLRAMRASEGTTEEFEIDTSKTKGLDALDGIPGVTREIMEAYEELREFSPRPDGIFRLLPDDTATDLANFYGSEEWSEFMVEEVNPGSKNMASLLQALNDCWWA